MSPLKLALIGAGAIGTTHAQVLSRREDVALVAICDPEPVRCLTLANATNARPYASAESLFSGEPIDGVIVATPPNTHAPITRLAATHGVHVLCEKPFAPSIDAAESMIAAANEHGTIVTMASKFRFVDDVHTARELLATGEIGGLLMMENAFTASVMMGARWNSNPAISGGGVIIDNGTHAVDVFRYLAGPLTDVSASEYRRYQRLPVEDTAMLFARCANGAVASSDLSWSIDKRLPWYLRLHCERGCIEIGWSASRVLRDGDSEWRTFGGGYRKLDAFAALQSNFIAAIRGTEPAAVSTSDAIASVVAIDAAYRSLEGAHIAWA